MNLHNDKDLFEKTIQKTARDFNYSKEFIEKDYWITSILKNLALSEEKKKFVFKGGTSLSKAHKTIKRFSEDIDISPIEKDSVGNRNKKFLRTIEKLAIHNLPLEEQSDKSKKGSKMRKVFYRYESIIEDDFTSLSEIILESTTFASIEKKNITELNIESYIAEVLKKSNQEDIIEKYDLHYFPIQVLSQEMTLSEKLMCLFRLSEAEKAFEKKG